MTGRSMNRGMAVATTTYGGVVVAGCLQVRKPCVGAGRMERDSRGGPISGEASLSDYDPFHFPSELIELLTSAVPLLNRSKRAVLVFFRSCGVPAAMLADLPQIPEWSSHPLVGSYAPQWGEQVTVHYATGRKLQPFLFPFGPVLADHPAN